MSSVKYVTVFDQIEDGIEIETEYHIGQRLPSIESSEPSEDNRDVVAELPKSRVRHVDDDDWEVSSKSKKYMSKLKEAKIKRLRAQHWNRSKTPTAEERDNVEEQREHPRGYHRPPNVMIGESPFDEHPEEGRQQPDTPKSLFSPSTMSDTESLMEVDKQSKTERYQRIINDPYAFSGYSDDVIPQVVLVANKSSKSEDLTKMQTNDPDEIKELEDEVVENTGSEDSWDIFNEYDGDKEDFKEPKLGEALTESKAESGDELIGVSYIEDDTVIPQPTTTTQPPSSPHSSKSKDKNNAVLDQDSPIGNGEIGEEPQPSFGNLSNKSFDKLQAPVKVKQQAHVSAITRPKENKDNDFPEQSVLELLMKRAELTKKVKKQAESVAKMIDNLSKEKSPKLTVIEKPSAKIEKKSPHEEVTSFSDAKLAEIPEQGNSGALPAEASLDEKNFKNSGTNSEPSKALLDSAFQMIARLQKENAEKDDRLRSSDLYVQTLEKKLFEEKNAMQEERQRRANMDSDQVSALKDKVSNTLQKLSCEEGKSKALQQLVNDLKEELEQEKNKYDKNQVERITTKTLLDREQNQVKKLQEDLKARDKTLEETKSRVQDLEEQLSLANKRAAQEHGRASELHAALRDAETKVDKMELKLEQTNMQLKTFQDAQNASKETKRNEEIMEKLKQSIQSRQQLIDEEEAKNQELLSKQLENASLAEDHRASAKKVEESLEKYFLLIQKETKEVNRLKQASKEREDLIAKERSLIKEFEAAIVKKNSMIDLEKVKQQALESSIAQKGRLVEIESAKMREHKALCAERLRQIEEDKETIRSAIQEKEELLCSEKAAIEYLQKMINTKRTLREERNAWEKTMTSSFGADPKKVSGIWTNDNMEAEEQKMILQELGKLRSHR